MRYAICIFIFFCFALTGRPQRASATVPTDSELSSSRPVFALVVGVNQSPEPKQVSLRYADDDAVQYAAFLEQLGDAKSVLLLTEKDKETSSIFPAVDVASPTRKNLMLSMQILNTAMEKEKSQGKKPIFYFVYTGHGNIKNNEGTISLKDSALTRSEFIELLKGSAAERNHVIIDACKSYFMVFERGPGGTRRKVRGEFLPAPLLPANTGVFLSTSAATNSHEWEVISAGVFSHEVRSALRGAADLNLDGNVTYEEAAAFIWNANQSIPVQRFRPVFFMAPPNGESAQQAVLADLSDANGHWLHARPAESKRQYIEDARGLRVAEFHPELHRNVSILLPKERPLFLRKPGVPYEYKLPANNNIDLSKLTATSAEVASRGAEHLAFLKLFNVPFAQSTLSKYQSALDLERTMNRSDEMIGAYRFSANADAFSPTRDTAGPSLRLRSTIGIAGLVLTGAGVGFTAAAFALSRQESGTENQVDTIERNRRIQTMNTLAVISFTAASVSLATWMIWTVVHRRRRRSPSELSGFNGISYTRYF